ncbi:hypothetical protein VTK56DRAFT_2767 [Thermocarpiscus australiensis]
MANDLPQNIPRLPSPEPATSEGNSSIQVHLDASSNRARSTRPPSRSPSRAPEPSLTRRATAGSLSSFLSSQPSSQPSQTDPAPAEDVLRDLITVTELSSNAMVDILHGMKRPHDDEVADGPPAKRDKLGEELEEMSASCPAHVPIPTPPVSSVSSASVNTPYPSTTHGAPTNDLTGQTVIMGARSTLPVRTSRRQLPQLGNGTSPPQVSRGAHPSDIPDPSGPNGEEFETHG